MSCTGKNIPLMNKLKRATISTNMDCRNGDSKNIPTNYVPSGKTVQAVVQSINDYSNTEVALPGNWSPTLFYSDLKTYPVISKDILANWLIKANSEYVSYLVFFNNTRNVKFPHIKVPYHNKLWEIFEASSIMLYFEKYFLKLISETDEDILHQHEPILNCIEKLSRHPIGEWDNIVSSVGACCYQFFSKHPELYLPVYTHLQEKNSNNSNKNNSLDCLTDKQLFEMVKLELYPTPYPGRVSIYESRVDLIKLCESVKR